MLQIARIRDGDNSRDIKPKSKHVVARIIGSARCEALDIVASGHAPVLTLCRELLAVGLDPDSAFDVFRGATLALRVRSIREGAKLAVEDNKNGRPYFRIARSQRVGAASPRRKTGRGPSSARAEALP